jgi:peptidase M1-like protein
MARSSPVSVAFAAVLLVSNPAANAIAQQSDTSSTPRSPLVAADRYAPVYDELRNMTPRKDRVAPVHDLTLRRDAIEFKLAQGGISLLTSVAGRTVGAVFVGAGSVSFAPPWDVERAQLLHVLGDTVLYAPISAVAFVFADSTQGELEHRLTFGAGNITPGASGVAGDAVDHLIEGRAHNVHSTLMAALLNGDANGFFYAYVKRKNGEDLIFEVDPDHGEQVLLQRGGRLEGQKVQTVCQFPLAADLGDSEPVDERERDPLKVEAYRIEATIAKGLDFSAATTVRFTARRNSIRWARFLLFSELQVDSVVDETGIADTFHRAKNSAELWVRLAGSLRAGETHSIRVVYHGDLLAFDSFRARPVRLPVRTPPGVPAPVVQPSVPANTWYFMKDPDTWFPRRDRATYGTLQAADMDMTFHSPSRYRLASVGRLVESRTDGGVQTTHWVTERPTTVASFNIGDFEETQIRDPRIPPVIMQVNGEGHRALRTMGALGGLHPEEDVGADVANSLEFFSRAFGPPLAQQFYATEIPYFYGKAFPGLIYLSFETFQTVNESGSEETFRSHEMAHQWWGIGVDAATYRDAWLSEGFAEFSGLWYTQVILNDNEKFFKLLEDRKREIRARRGDVAPIGLGDRLIGMDHPRDYSLMVYAKGAWVLQMVRNMMIDFRTMKEDAFTAMMQDFYQQYRGRRASTQDFQRVVEQHVNLPMDWFFNEWVNGTAIPTYILSWHGEPASDNKYLLHVRVRQEDVPSDFVMPVPLEIDFKSGGHATIRVTVRGPVTDAQLQLPSEPAKLVLNPLESVLADVKEEGWH